MRPAGSRSGFNAATAVSPWRTSFGAARAANETQASMRQRRCRRGERGLASTTCVVDAVLQCGHGGVAVENARAVVGGEVVAGPSMRPRRCRRGERRYTALGADARDALQCGHGGVAVENDD